jgi:hypothetical protein
LVAVSDEEFAQIWKAVGSLGLSLGALRSIVIRVAYRQTMGWSPGEIEELNKDLEDGFKHFGDVIELMQKHRGEGI